MGVRDWPQPVRHAIGRVLMLVALAIILAPLFFLATAALSSNRAETAWLGILGGYSTVITVPVSIVVALAVIRYLANKREKSLYMHLMMGASFGVIVGLFMAAITGGYSLLSAPPTVGLIIVVRWLIRRPDRDAPNPATAAP